MNSRNLGCGLFAATVLIASAPLTSQERTTPLEEIPDAVEFVYDIGNRYEFSALGILPEESFLFTDTEKPNALVIYPGVDPSGAFYDIPQPHLHGIRSTYDTSFTIAYTEQDVYRAIRHAPDIELLIIGGHGARNAIALGAEDPTLYSQALESGILIGFDEEHYIDRNDAEMKAVLSQLHPLARTFLLSCATAEGGEDADNLANKVKSWAGEDRIVFASTKSFHPQDIRVASYYPFETEILGFSELFVEHAHATLTLLNPFRSIKMFPPEKEVENWTYRK